MFCQKCGTRVQDNAKFCYMCGAKIDNNFTLDSEVEVRNIRNDDLVEDYTKQIQDKVLRLYLRGKKISPNTFYDKASLYDMTQHDVDNVYNHEMSVIEHLNDYINKIFLDGKKYVALETFNPDDFEQYASMLGIEKDLSHEFWNNYIERNEINEKQDFLSDLIHEYGATGKVFQNVPKKYRNIRTVSSEILLEQYKKIILQIELLLEKEYAASNNDELTNKQYKRITNEIVKMGLLKDYTKYFISGYEKKSGIENKRFSERKDRVLKRVQKDYDRNYIILGTKVTFNAKYFLRISIESFLNETLRQFKIEYENMSKTSSNAIYDLIDIFERYDTNFFDAVNKIENLFEINMNYMKQCRNLFDTIWNVIGEIGKEFGVIEDRVAIKKMKRQEATRNRGRWQGGGFGVSGAIKGAATASAMNAVTGVAYAGAGLIGNAISGLAATYSKQKGIKRIKAAFPMLENMDIKVTECFMKGIREEYPELYFDPYARDTSEEQELRKKLVHIMCPEDKERLIIIKLLEINPANWRNGIEILGESMKNPQFLDKDSAKAYEDLGNFFEWNGNFNREIHEVSNELSKNKGKIQAWETIDEEICNRAEEVCGLSKRFLRAAGEGNELSKELRNIEESLILINKINEFNSIYIKIQTMNKEEVFEIGSRYCNANEWIPAKKIFLKYINNHKKISELLDTFYEKSNNNAKQLTTLLDEFIKEKTHMDSKQYEKTFYILARLKNKAGKTLLIYAAEEHDELLTKELIKYGADVELLKKIIDANYTSGEKKEIKMNTEEDYRVCPSCGKAILKTAKFCNYCGEKITNGGDTNEMSKMWYGVL